VPLALLGLLTVVVLVALIMTRAASALVALVIVPVAAALLGGFGLRTGTFMVTGIQQIAPVAGMFVFAILYFGVMTDAGLLDPVVVRILRVIGHHPARVVVGSALLALLVHLDGSGAVTFLVTIPAVLPLYDRLGIDRRVLACVVSMAAGANFLPWTGPMIRASAALGLPVTTIFRPLVPVQIAGLVFVFATAYALGLREARRIRRAAAPGTGGAGPERTERALSSEQRALRRPDRFWVNAILTIVMMVLMVAGVGDPVVVFLIGTVLALLINYPSPSAQRARIDAHARAAMMMAAILFAAGAFTGIMQASGMLKAMATAAVAFVPHGAAQHIPVALGLVSMPLSLLFDPDSFYLGVLPVLAETAHALGVPTVQVAQAALLGQMTTGFPISPLTPATFLLVGLTELDLGEHQRFAFPYLLLTSVVMTVAAVVFGVFPL
jgi:CitMHS family citrate-Mg2+:H+ or citrate-Ca2+:H+ symporter